MMPVRHLLGPRVTYEGYKGDMLLELSGFLSKVAGSFELLRMISEIVPSVIRGYHNHCVWPEGSKEIKIQKMFLLWIATLLLFLMILCLMANNPDNPNNPSKH